MKKTILAIALVAVAAGLALTMFRSANKVDLLRRYPTTLTSGVLDPSRALPWQFSSADIFLLSGFHLAAGNQLKLETGPAKLGIGSCADGAVWAVVIPAQAGQLTRPDAGSSEEVASIWLRFNPKEIDQIFPPNTVTATTDKGLESQMQTIANAKFRASYHAGMNAMIPAPKDMVVDVDTRAGLRRFFSVDTEAQTAQYVSAFEAKAVRLPSASQSASGSPADNSGPPKIVATTPADGATDVDPGLTEITVTFNQDMSGGMSWTGGGPDTPSLAPGARPHWRDQRTCVLPVRLQAGHHYRIGINSPSHRNFRNTAGLSVQPSSINFTTK